MSLFNPTSALVAALMGAPRHGLHPFDPLSKVSKSTASVAVTAEQGRESLASKDAGTLPSQLSITLGLPGLAQTPLERQLAQLVETKTNGVANE
ncbi:MAG: hypothetical protein R3273_05405 [Pseudidiomarina maritima]|uniref:Uncharacterized protein n=1 Tax=Pseudidiomarina fusca TaxID=2965078 RepID=A0ABU3KXQ1_9GAMM|nr:hypothetical protein [Pseudidiomarina sp. GXY010]MDT7526144.1 hypothetical protein [Pseudidiomarina sp. GXY010]MDX1525658.1 hypothetical protein [Pseudidiomarina maritima]